MTNILMDVDNRVRDTKPVLKEDTTWKEGDPVNERFSIEAALKLGIVPAEELYRDMLLQLNAAQAAAVHFEKEAVMLAGVVDLQAKRIGELYAENESFWSWIGAKLARWYEKQTSR